VTVDLVALGPGYVGLPLAQEAVRSGLAVRGVELATASQRFFDTKGKATAPGVHDCE